MTDSPALPAITPTPDPSPCDCLGRTCLKWGADGELTDLDLRLVMQRLARVDPEVSALAARWPPRSVRTGPEPGAQAHGFHQGLRGGASWLPSQRG
jgi:hypothetical protein